MKIKIYVILIFIFINLTDFKSYTHPITSFPVYKNEPEYISMKKYLSKLPDNVIAKIGNFYINKKDYINWLLEKFGYKKDLFNTFIHWVAFQESAKKLSIKPDKNDYNLLVNSAVDRDIKIYKENKITNINKVISYSNIRYHYYKKYLIPALVIYKLYKNVSYKEFLYQLKKEYGIYNRRYEMKVIFLKFSPKYLVYNTQEYKKEIKRLEKEARKILNKAIKDIKNGMTFDKAAELYSDDVLTRYIGGYLGKFKRGIYGNNFDKVVQNLKEGEISNPVTTPIGIHIVKCVKRDSTGIYIAHIQRKINRYEVVDRRSLQIEKKRLLKIMKVIQKKIANGESFEKLSEQYSDNYLSAYQFKSRVECHEFFEILFAKELLPLNEGDISNILISDKGIQIIKVYKVKYTEFNQHTVENVKKKIFFNKIIKDFDFYGEKLLKKMKVSNIFTNPDYLFIINNKKIFKLDYGNWLYNYLSSDVLIENYITMILFERKAKELHIDVTSDEIDKIRREKMIQNVPPGNKNPFVKMKFELVLREIGSDLLASRILFKTTGIPEDLIKKKFIEKFGFSGIKYKLQYKVSFAGNRYAKDKANEIYKKLLNGTNFNTLAKKYSDDTNSSKIGGYIGEFKIEDWDFNVYKVIKSMKKNEISKPIKMKDGYHIFYINNIKKNKIYLSHIFISSILRNMRDYEKIKLELDNPLKKIFYYYYSNNINSSLLNKYNKLYLMKNNETLWVPQKNILSPDKFILEKDKFYIIEDTTSLHIVKVLNLKTNKLTSKIREELKTEIYNSITDYGKILKLGLKLMKEYKVIYKEQNSEISVLKIF